MATSRRITTTLYGFLYLVLGSITAAAAAPPSASPSPLPPPDQTHDLRLDFEPAGLTGLLSSLRRSPAQGLIPANAPRWQRLHVDNGGSLVTLLQDAGVQSDAWYHVLAAGAATDPLKHLQPGDQIAIKHGASGQLLGLRYAYSSTETLVVSRNGQTLNAYVAHASVTTRRVIARGTVRQSVARSLTQAEVPASIATQLAHIFKPRINLSREIQQGDTFSVMYRVRYSGGKHLGSGPIIAATITTYGDRISAFRARNQHGEVGYYDRRGRAFARSILRTPLNYTRVSSPFSLSRINPVTGQRAPHEGVDLAASMGTPVHAAADGTIAFEGWISGYGRIVKINNFGPYSTRYAHLSQFAQGLHDGEHVEQGEIIGYVGQSGRTTGPHLHFEIRRNGVPHDPLSMDLPVGRHLAQARIDEFQQRIKPLLAKLERSPDHLVVASRTPLQNILSCRRNSRANVPLARDSGPISSGAGTADLLCTVNR